MWPAALSVVVAAVLANVQLTHSLESYDYGAGAGTRYIMHVKEDVTMEHPSTNYNHLPHLLVAQHPGWPLKRSLVRMENPPDVGVCQHMLWAKLYLYFIYAHKWSKQSVNVAPWVSHDIMAYMVLKPWNEAQSTSITRVTGSNWAQLLLDTSGVDAGPCLIGEAPLCTGRPASWIEIDVTKAVEEWRNGKPNYGLLLRVKDEVTLGRDLRFASNAHLNTDLHARIHVQCDP